MKKTITAISLALLATAAVAQKYEGLARTPQMGWNSWNKFADKVNEDVIKETADALVRTGLRDAGYVYLNIDDCWHGERDKDGFIQSDPQKFSLGIAALAEYCHNRGLKLGIYSDAGRQTCGGRPGSFGHEYQDALQYARWGVDYLKYDWCNTEDINARGAYRLMSEALKAAGRPILFSMCEWGDTQGYSYGAPIAHSWRTTGDIWCHFDGLLEHGSWHANGVVQNMDINAKLRKYAGPDHWNDPDMLEVGNGMSVNEDRAHFTMWCMMAAPLILGNDLNNMTQETLDILTNREVIAIDQDTLGIQGLRIEQRDSIEVWLKPLAGDDWAFCLLNRSITPKDVTLDWERWNTVDDEVSGRIISFSDDVYQWKNLWWTGAKPQTGLTRSKKPQVVNIPGHDVVLYRLTPKNPLTLSHPANPVVLNAPAKSRVANFDFTNGLAGLKNGAKTEELNGQKILNLGSQDGYYDMTADMGKVIKSLKDFTLSVYYKVEAKNELDGYGHFLFACSALAENSADEGPYVAFRLNEQRFETSTGGYAHEEIIMQGGKPQRDVWHHAVYRQKGHAGEFFIDGQLIGKNANMPILAEIFADAPAHCWIGKAPFKGDKYLSDTKVADLQIFNYAISDKEMNALKKTEALK